MHVYVLLYFDVHIYKALSLFPGHKNTYEDL